MEPSVNDLLAKPKTSTGVAPSLPSVTQLAKPPVNPALPSVRQLAAPKPTPNLSLSVDDVINDTDRLGKIRRMMSKTKDVYYETAPPEEVMEDFMSHMRWLNTNEVSTAREAFNVAAADDETKAIYGDAYRVYDEMGSMFSNGDAWNGMIDYGSAFVTSPSLWLGIGVGKLAGQAGTKAAAKAITTGAQQIAKQSGGRVAAETAKQEIKNTAAKAAARYHITGALVAEAPLATLQDAMLQEIRMETGVQDEFSFLQSAISTAAGGISALPGIITLRRSSGSSFAETGKLLDESYKQRAKTSAKRAAPRIKKSLEKAQLDWLKLAENGVAFENNVPLQRGVFNWFFNFDVENGLARILQEEGADLSFEEGAFTRDLLAYAMNMGDENLEAFNKAFEPLGVTFGEATTILANSVRSKGQDMNVISQTAKVFKELRNFSAAKKHSAQQIVESATDGNVRASDANVTAKDMLGYAQSVWKKMLVSTLPTTAVNVKGWAIARSSAALADLTIAGGLMGRAGMRAVINPAGALKDLSRARALAQNQTFALQTLVDPFLSSEAFMALVDRAPTKVRKELTGQLFGGVEDWGPASYGLNPSAKSIKAIEKTSDLAQKISFAHLQDTLTKGVSGLTALDRESRLAFGKGIQQLIEEGEAWRLTDEMWEKSMAAVLRETFSEDLSRGTHMLRGVAEFIQNLSATPGVGFFIPFGKFLNNTVAFTYRHSPLGYFGVAGRVFKGQRGDEVAQAAARATVGTMALTYLYAEQQELQKQGLQWFERRNDDGSVEDITTLFPYSVYALTGRIVSNAVQGEGMDQGLIDSLLQQIGPLDALENVASPPFIRDFARWMTDPSVEDEERNAFFGTIADAMEYVAGTTGEILAGYTRPLDTYSRALSFANPEMGGGVVIDRKQAEGTMEKFALGATRYTSAFFNYLLGEEKEEGVRLFGEAKQSATSMGPARIPNPFGTIVGSNISPKPLKLSKLLGMVDKPPYLVDSFTSGNPEYDDFINKTITPMLERKADSLLKNDVFLKAPQSVKIERVNDMIRDTRKEVLELLEGRRIGDKEDRLINERRKLLVKDRQARIRAMKALGITTEEHKLSLFEIEAIKRRMDLEKEEIERIK